MFLQRRRRRWLLLLAEIEKLFLSCPYLFVCYYTRESRSCVYYQQQQRQQLFSFVSVFASMCAKITESGHNTQKKLRSQIGRDTYYPCKLLAEKLTLSFCGNLFARFYSRLYVSSALCVHVMRTRPENRKCFHKVRTNTTKWHTTTAFIIKNYNFSTERKSVKLKMTFFSPYRVVRLVFVRCVSYMLCLLKNSDRPFLIIWPHWKKGGVGLTLFWSEVVVTALKGER